MTWIFLCLSGGTVQFTIIQLLTLLKRNKHISKLKRSSTGFRPLLGQKQPKAIVLERQEYLLQCARKEVLSAMREQRKLEAVRAVQCLDRPSDSVERLMTQHQTKTAKFSALSVQLRYHHVVLGSGSKLLNKTKLTPDQITDNLILYLGIHCLLWNTKML